MFIKRKLLSRVKDTLVKQKKGVIIYGPRQVGKTTLVNQLVKDLGLKTLIISGDRRGADWDLLTSLELEKLKLLIGDNQLVFIDEAQRIPEIGLASKIILDNFFDVKLILTGSSSLDLASRVSEPLTGRAYSYHLYPIWQGELALHSNHVQLVNQLEERLIFGSYPEAITIRGYKDKIEYLTHLKDAYLYKDLLEFGQIKHADKIYDLLRLLALQVGSQVSVVELANSLALSRNTVERYIDLLEKSFVIFSLSGFSRNLRREVKKMDKIFFWDNGVRNAVIGDFNLLKSRSDVGQLWENFLITERIKRQSYLGHLSRFFFWRLSSGAEIDLVEEEAGKLFGFEFKWSKSQIKPPRSWFKAYPTASFQVVNKDNWLEFVL